MSEKILKIKEKYKKAVWIATIAVAGLILLIGILLFSNVMDQKKEAEIISKSTLEKIINVSELSTFEAVYNGIAQVMNEDNPKETDYYVSYDTKVKAGIDFEQVDVSVDNENKKITVVLPEVEITDVEVDITSLDYIFMNDGANTETVSEQAYKACIEDVSGESAGEKAIYELARQNARNIVEALISPFVKQLDAEYVLEIK